MPWTTYKEKIARLSHRIVELQKPVRILDSIKWDHSIEAALRKSNFKELPSVGPEYYERNTLGFDPAGRLDDFRDLVEDIDKIP